MSRVLTVLSQLRATGKSSPVPVERVMITPGPILDVSHAPTAPWHGFFAETRTRVLMLHTLLLIALTGLSIPIFRQLLFSEIDARVQRNLDQERTEFLTAYDDWQRATRPDAGDLGLFINTYLSDKLPEDDNFHIVIFGDKSYQSNPTFLPAPLSPGTALFQEWQETQTLVVDEVVTDSPKIGTIIYEVEPLMLYGQQQGVYVFAHTSAGERQESLVGVYLFIRIILVVGALSLLLSWIVAGRLMAPIRSLSQIARTISETDLTQRIAPVQGNNELADLAKTFNEMMNRIEQAFESQRSFINDAGHELRTPITIIRGHLELLGDDPQERKMTTALVIDELDRMGRLVNDMLLLAKAEQGDFVQLETVEVGQLCEHLFTKAQTFAPRNWTLNIKGTGKIVADRQQLTGALLNLLRNAAQHTQASDTIELGCSFHLTTSTMQFWVKDTGEGISPDDQQRIFARFARGKHRKYRGEGVGLGLAIVCAIAQTHQGKIQLTSEVDQGSTFYLTLPVEQAQPVFSA